MKRPAFQFYPADWRKDPSLSTCSLAARGLWIELMCIMHEANPYGVLAVNGKPMTDLQISRAVGEPLEVITQLLEELEASGVYSRDDAGAMFSRRMLRDEHVRNVRAAAGKLGGNPALIKRKDIHPPKQKPTPSSSSSSSTSEELLLHQPGADAVGKPRKPSGEDHSPAVAHADEPPGKARYPADFEAFWSAYPRRVGKLAALKAYVAAKRLLGGAGAAPRLLKAAEAYAAATAGKDEKYVAHPTTWLNQGRWDDAPGGRQSGAVGRDAFGVGG